jgi:hypothetical protein
MAILLLGSTFVSFTTLSMIGMVTMSFMQHFRFLPLMAFTRNSSEEQTSGEQVKSFHLRRV